jgi:hypothetical protein
MNSELSSNEQDNLAAMMSTETLLMHIWQEIFDTTEINADSDFFDLGGNSITAIKLLAQVEKVFGPETLLPEALFTDGRLRSVAMSIDAQRNKKANKS